METLIIIDEETPGASQGAVMTQAKAASCDDLLFVKASNPCAVKNSFQYAAGSRIILLNGTAFATSKIISELLQAEHEGIVVAKYLTKQAEVTFVPHTPDELYKLIVGDVAPAILALSAPKDFFTSATLTARTSSQMIVELMIKAITQGENINITEKLIDVSEISQKLVPVLHKQESAVLLQQLIKSFNVEEIFPNYAWDKHAEESAALSFHQLAGAFMRLGDANMANECLEKGDQLEDSPRSLALRGIICEKSGKTLEAVAQMVSSLQRYEVRKKENDMHYVNFTPKNLERINASLHAGLEALNKRDNQRAFECFSRAIFDFDPFFEELGLS